MYWLMWGILSFGVLMEVYGTEIIYKNQPLVKAKSVSVYFIFATVCMFLMAALRYGQGQDYMAYASLYQIDVYPYVDLVNKEPGYVFCAFMLNKMGVPFEVFVALLAAFEMYCFYRCIMKYGEYKIMGLLLLYPTLFLTYMFSGFRQAGAIAIFCGFVIPCLKEKKWLKFVIAVLAAASFHKTVLVMLILPIIYKIKYKNMCKLILAAAAAGVVLCLVDVSGPLTFILQDRAVVYVEAWGNSDISIMGIAERTLLAGFVVWNIYKAGYEEEDCVTVFSKIYLAGYMLSVLTVRYQLMSSRLGVYCKALDIVLIPMLIYRMKPRSRKIMTAIVLAYAFVFLYKNIAMYIAQGGYNATVWTYPYITIFNKAVQGLWK